MNLKRSPTTLSRCAGKTAFCLEPHFTLPNFNGIPVRELWKECIPIQEGACRHVLPPELNLLLLYRHNNIDFFRKSNLPKLLTDLGFLLKSSRINWEKLARLCRNFRFGTPELLFQAFPEFFPELLRRKILPPKQLARCGASCWRLRSLKL